MISRSDASADRLCWQRVSAKVNMKRKDDLMKKTLMILLVVLSLFAISLPCAAAESYWSWQEDWTAAVDRNDGDEIIQCVKRLEAIYSNPSSETEHARLCFVLERGALEYEKKSLYPEAYSYYQKALKSYQWLNDHGTNYYDKLLILKAQLQHLQGYFEIYATTSQPTDVPYYGAKNEPRQGTYYGMCGTWLHHNQSAYLQYVQFPTEYVDSYAGNFLDLKEDSLLEIAWNVRDENKGYETKDCLDEINSGKYDQYIIHNLKYLNSIGHKVLLRFGAEVNVWVDLPSDANGKAEYCRAFKSAFQRVAKFARQYAPNCAMVYSPNDISNWNYSVTDFYPGDEYVDWVGMSSYSNQNNDASGAIGSGTDAFYCRGLYENQMIQIKNIIDAFGSRKPIMISECGFAYATSDANDPQTLGHALAAQKYFYTYVNMVYPQIKAIFYFNASPKAHKYEITANNNDAKQMLSQYQYVTKNNVSMQATVDANSARYYTELENLNDVSNQITLSAFAYYPSNHEINVSYILDGKQVYSSAQYPYSYTTSKPSTGLHYFTAKMVCGATTQTKNYGIYVKSDGSVSAFLLFNDVPSDSWFTPYIYDLTGQGILDGRSDDIFDPDGNITRGEFAKILAFASKDDLSQYEGTSKFTDSRGHWSETNINWAYQNGIVKGQSETSFAPNAKITRQEMAVMIKRYADYKGIQLPQTNEAISFADDGKIASWAKVEVTAMQQAGIISGRPGNLFDPEGNATRGEAAKMISILLDL